MATHRYTRVTDVAIIPEALAAAISAAIGGRPCSVQVGNLWIDVTAPTLDRPDDDTVQSVINAYVYDPTWNAPPERKRLANAADALRAWAGDARAEVLAWDGQTRAQRDAATKVLFDRFGTLCDRIADLLTVEGNT